MAASDGGGRGGGSVGGGGGRLVALADLQRDPVLLGREQLFHSGGAADVAGGRAHLRVHLAGRHTLHDRHQHPRQCRSAEAIHALCDQPDPVTSGSVMTHK